MMFPLKYEEIELISGGSITKTRNFMSEKKFTGCVHYSDGRICERSLRSRHLEWKPKDIPLEIGKILDLPFSGETVLYGGHLPGHFGHFLVETPARLWVAEKDVAYDKIIFNRFVDGSSLKVDDEKICSLLDSLKIDRVKLIVLDQDTRFSRILVPSPKFMDEKNATHPLASVYEKWKHVLISDKKTTDCAKVYVSRWRIAKERNDNSFNEFLIEEFFRNLGYEVIYPETMSFAEQVRFFASANVIAGLGGSALHLSVFMKRYAHTLVIGTHRWPKSNGIQKICNAISGAKLTFFPFEGHLSKDINFQYTLDFCKLEKAAEEISSFSKVNQNVD